MIEAKLNIRNLERGLRGLANRAANAQPFFAALKKPMREDQKAHGRQQSGPKGPWAPRANASKQTSKGRGKRRRQRRLLGRLTTAVRYKSSADDVRAKSRARWSRVHQEGGRAGQGADIPARPFLWLSREFVGDSIEALLQYVTRDWGRK